MKNTVCRPLFESFAPAIRPDSENRIADMGRTNVINIFNTIVRDFHIVFQRWINFVSSRVALKSTHVKNVSIRA